MTSAIHETPCMSDKLQITFLAPVYNWIMRWKVEKQPGVTIDFRLDGNLFNIKRLQATTKFTSEDIMDLQYAHAPEALQNTLLAAVTAYRRMGLPCHPTTFTAEGQQLATVPAFKYLGSIISDSYTMDDEIQNHLKQASASFGRLRRKVFLNSNLNLHTKVLVYQAVCITTCLYGCEA
ncbi:hypothetical protein SKAU_G00171530 [Synaphobranchus kaupii]|uniref:Uncharacterized protein n=1 Tax=Synaphobranchus kaupii TaxID=118154 RepID=A0A9Q1FKS2_SYNKA|nr:hypothetical protein SKAU_G00171530 [Synaphobranchus kaupii]